MNLCRKLSSNTFRISNGHPNKLPLVIVEHSRSLQTSKWLPKKKPALLTTSNGAPIEEKTASMTVGQNGPILLQDFTLIDELAHLGRERIPERVAHAKGAGAFGYFEVTKPEITKYCKAALFSEVGKKTNISLRFSTVVGENGSADTVRDPRGFAVKHYTEEGNWDLVGNNTPIYFIRDPMLMLSFVHAHRRNPQTHLKDPNAFWDFMSLRSESTQQIMFLFSDRGIPDGYRHMNGYGSHTYKLVNAAGEPFYCKFHYKTNQGIKNLPVDQAAELVSCDPDYAIRDLFNAIASGDFPSWTLYVQVMSFKQAEKYKWNPFDITKVWLHSEFPMIEVGCLVLDRNPRNYFVDVELAAYSPSHLVPGIEPSPCKLLQGRLFSYPDSQRYRLGVNYQQLPVNCPHNVRVANNLRDGAMCFGDNQGNSPNYFPNSFDSHKVNPRGGYSKFATSGDVARYNSDDMDNFSQATVFWNKTLKEEERTRLVSNIVEDLKDAAPFIQERAVSNFCQVDAKFGEGVAEGLQKHE